MDIAKNSVIHESIGLIFPATDSCSIQLTIKIGENALASVIEKFDADTDRNIDYKLTVQADKNSQLKVITLQNLTPKSTFNESRSTDVKAGGRVHFLNFQLGAKSAKGVIYQKASGTSGDLNVDLLCRAKGDQNYDFDVTNSYDAKNGQGKIFVKGIALGQSRLKMNGAIKITRKGGGTDTYLKQDSLLLSDQARVSATPGLNINTNDVKASHGASITNLSDELLFYLNSRGINKNEARKMMMTGFAAEQIDKISDMPEVKNYILTNL